MKYLTPLTILFSLLAHVVIPGVNALERQSSESNQLMHYAQVASVSYCLKKGLKKGKLGDKKSKCPISACKEDDLKDIELLKTFDFNDWGEVGSGYYAIDHKLKRILLVFRGTASRRDWVGDLDVIPVNYDPMASLEGESVKETAECDGCKVHRGFYNFLAKNCVEIMQEVQKLKEEYPDYKLIVVGHSLGAALALLSGIRFRLMGLQPLVISYASPKVGNQQMVEFVDRLFNTDSTEANLESDDIIKDGYIRVVHKNDIVTSLPPSPVFKHGGFEYYIDQRSLPHDPRNIHRRGTQFTDESSVELETINVGKLWPEALGKYEHSHYLVKITGCDDSKK